MKVNKLSIIISITLFCILLCSINAQAGSAKDIMAKMQARLPEINQLKTKGVIGEGRDGYLALINNSQDNLPLLKAENNDRQKIYTAIARQQGSTIVQVGQRRALQITQRARAGTWLQTNKGTWYRK